MIPLCLTCAIVAETQGRRAYGLQRLSTCEWCGAVARCGIGSKRSPPAQQVSTCEWCGAVARCGIGSKRSPPAQPQPERARP